VNTQPSRPRPERIKGKRGGLEVSMGIINGEERKVHLEGLVWVTEEVRERRNTEFCVEEIRKKK